MSFRGLPLRKGGGRWCLLSCSFFLFSSRGTRKYPVRARGTCKRPSTRRHSRYVGYFWHRFRQNLYSTVLCIRQKMRATVKNSVLIIYEARWTVPSMAVWKSTVKKFFGLLLGRIEISDFMVGIEISSFPGNYVCRELYLCYIYNNWFFEIFYMSLHVWILYKYCMYVYSIWYMM